MKKLRKVATWLFVWTILLSTLFSNTASAATVPAGYHLGNYHNSGNWTEWGVALDSCDNYKTDSTSRECVHYLERKILSSYANGPDGMITDGSGNYYSTWGKIPTSLDDPRWAETYSINGTYIMRCSLSSNTVVRKGSSPVLATYDDSCYCVITTDNKIWTIYPEWQYTDAFGTYCGTTMDKAAAQATANSAGLTYPTLYYSRMAASLFAVETLNCQDSEEQGKYVYGAAFYYWGSVEHQYQNGAQIGITTDSYGFNVDGTKTISSQFGTTEYRKVIQVSNGYKCNYFAGYDLLGETKQYVAQSTYTSYYYSSGTRKSVSVTKAAGSYNPSYYSALYGKTFTGLYVFNGGIVEEVTYASDGSIVFQTNAASGFAREGSSHRIDRYQCLGHPVPNTYKITYVLDGGSMSTAGPATATYDKSFTVVNPTKTGYEFQGWKITGMSASAHVIGGTTTSVTSVTTKATGYKNLTTVNGGTVTFTAVWKDVTPPKVSYTLSNADGTTYTEGTWTKQNVTMKITATDTNSVANILAKAATPSVATLVDKDVSGTSATASTSFSGSGERTGTITATDAEGLTASTDYGPIKIDQTAPIGSVSYKLESNGKVTVTVTASDAHSGLHSKPYSWDGGKTWVTTKTYSSSQSESGNVVVRDAVGNTKTIPWKVTTPSISYSTTNADGTSYTEDTWTNQNVVLKVTASDDNMKISNITIEAVTPSNAVLVDKDYSNPSSASAQTSFGGTGERTGEITATNSIGIESTIEYGPIKIDQTPPEGEVSYDPSTDTNRIVVVTVTASDADSGLHAKPYSYDDGKTWTALNTLEVTENSTGTVVVRDKVGNTTEIPWKITWIDKITPQVTASAKTSSGTTTNTAGGKANEEWLSGGCTSTEVIFIEIWSNKPVELNWSATDIKSSVYKATGISSMVFYSIDNNFTDASRTAITSNMLNTPTAYGKSASLSYTVSKEGETYYQLLVKDAVGNRTVINYTIRYDGSLISHDATQSSVQMADISKMTDAEIENAVVNGTPLVSTFNFFLYDENKSSNKTDKKDASGIKSVYMYLYDADYESTVKQYIGNYSNEAGFTSLLPAGSGSLYNLTSSRSGGENTVNSGHTYSGYYSAAIDTFGSFPKASGLRYVLIAYDYAGNRSIYAMADGEVLQNFSIKAVVYSSVGSDFNIKTPDGLSNIPYFKTGDCGYVDVWTVGYVEEISFDFLDVGNESATAIKEGNLLQKYNLGTKDVPGYDRHISASKSTGLDGAFAMEGSLHYANHYTYKVEGWESEGTLIRIPPTYDLDADLSAATENGDTTYIYQDHYANITAYKDGASCTTTAQYVLYSTSRFGIHHRVTYETPGTN